MSETYTFRSIFSKPISYAKDEDPIVNSSLKFEYMAMRP